MKKVTIRDVAREAGVSVATVSNVLNGVEKCRVETRERVLETARELGYQPNISAKTLATRRSGLLGIVINEKSEGSSFSQMNLIVNGMNSAIRRYENYDLIITEVFRDGSREYLRDWVAKRDLEGIIFLGDYEEETLREIEGIGIPMVMVDNYGEELKEASYIHSEDTLGSYLAVEHLIERGSRRIAFVCGTLDENEVYRRRFYGYKAAIEEYGLALTEENIVETEESFRGGYDATRRICESGEADAIFFSYSEGALGALKYLNGRREIPGEMKIIAFGDTQAWEYTIPSLTSTDQQVSYKGELAVDMIIDKIGGSKKFKREVSIPVKIRVRETT